MVVKFKNQKLKITKKEVIELLDEKSRLAETAEALRRRIALNERYYDRCLEAEAHNKQLKAFCCDMSHLKDDSEALLNSLQSVYSTIKDETIRKYAYATLKYPKFKLFELKNFIGDETYKKQIIEIAYSNWTLESEDEAKALATRLRAKMKSEKKPKPIAPLERVKPKTKTQEELER